MSRPLPTTPNWSERRARPRRPHRARRRPAERVRLLGEAVDLVRPEEVMRHVEHWVDQGRRAVVANHNLHSLALVRRDPAMRRFYDRASLIEVDSAPLIAFSRLIGLHARPMHRCTYLDWREHFWSVASRRGWRVFYLGGAPGVAETAAERLRAERPGVRIDTAHGYFDAAPGGAQNLAVLRRIAAARPHVLFVGMGMPRQERWIVDNLDALPPCVVFSVGAAFDYEAGAQRAAPRWMGRAGLEWLFRLAVDPRRLARRYLVEPWMLAPRAALDVVAAVRRRARLTAPRPQAAAPAAAGQEGGASEGGAASLASTVPITRA